MLGLILKTCWIVPWCQFPSTVPWRYEPWLSEQLNSLCLSRCWPNLLRLAPYEVHLHALTPSVSAVAAGLLTLSASTPGDIGATQSTSNTACCRLRLSHTRLVVYELSLQRKHLAGARRQKIFVLEFSILCLRHAQFSVETAIKPTVGFSNGLACLIEA